MLGSGKGRTDCLLVCDMEVEGNMVVKQKIFSKMMRIRQLLV